MVLDLDHSNTLLNQSTKNPTTTNMPHSISMALGAGAISPSDKTARSSFSSVRENDDGLAQTFTRSKISSYTNEADPVFDESPSVEISQPAFLAPLTQPNSKLHGFWAPAPTFKGWREIPLKGKKASRSYENLRNLDMEWSPPQTPKPEKTKATFATGQSPFECLPGEVLGTLDPTLCANRNADIL